MAPILTQNFFSHSDREYKICFFRCRIFYSFKFPSSLFFRRVAVWKKKMYLFYLQRIT